MLIAESNYQNNMSN